MKTLLLKLSILILITGLSFNAFTQTINIDSAFYSDTEICPFSEMKNMFINYNEEMLRTRYKRARAESLEHNNMLHIFPNPAGNYFIIDYSFTFEISQSVLFLTDADGKIIRRMNLPNKQNQVVISMENYPVGLYFVNLYNKDKLMESAKVIITK